MKVLISLFQVLVMVLVVLFVIGVLEVVSYRTVNESLFQSVNAKSEYVPRKDELFHIQHWTIRYTRPYWFNP